MCVGMQVCGAERAVLGILFFSFNMGAPGVSLGNKCLYLQSHLAGPMFAVSS